VIARTEHRTNEIMTVLALASILLLPGAPIAGVMGMNVNLRANVFAGSVLFWVVAAVIVLLAGGTLGTARVKHWIWLLSRLADASQPRAGDGRTQHPQTVPSALGAQVSEGPVYQPEIGCQEGS
jgi:CorA-like Mg2+ transporter protein